MNERVKIICMENSHLVNTTSVNVVKNHTQNIKNIIIMIKINYLQNVNISSVQNIF